MDPTDTLTSLFLGFFSSLKVKCRRCILFCSVKSIKVLSTSITMAPPPSSTLSLINNASYHIIASYSLLTAR